MSDTMTRRFRGSVAAAAVAALALTPLAALASETAEPSPEATPEAISAEVDDQPVTAAPVPKDNEFSLGQSLQIRVGPDAEPNSSLANFRWSVNQLTVQGEEEGPMEVPVPDRGALIRSLLDFSNPPQDDGIATLTADMSNGFGLARTVSLWPQDENPPIELEASFTLDGEPIEAWDLVGKSGEVSATYTLTNTSTQEVEVEVEDLAGETVTRTVEADVPMVGITKTLIPQSYTGLRLQGGTFGADGRGNNQVQFISLPFRPISKDGTATFGWAARVENATLPSLVIQVAPIYIPEDDPESAEDESVGVGGLGLPAPNLDPAISQIQSGVAQLIEGLDGFAAASGGPDPLDEVQDRLNNFFSEFGTNLTTVGTLVDPANPDGATALVVELQEAIGQVEGLIAAIEENDVLAKIEQAAGVLTPDNAALLASVADPLQNVADNASIIASAISAYCAIPERLRPDIPQIGRPLTNAECDQARQGAEVIQSDRFQSGVAFLNQVQDQLVPAAEALQVLNRQLPGVITALTPILATLNGVLVQLEAALTDLSGQLTTIGGGLEEANIDLPSLDAVVSNVVDQILNSPPGQNVTGGLGQISAGVGDARSILGSYLAEVVVTLQGVGQRVGETAADVDAAVVTVKSEIAGLKQMAHTSPLPYGGDPAEAPEGTVLAGAFEFRVDAADTNQPNTGPRILVGLVALIGAGALSYFVGRTKTDADAGAAAQPDPQLETATVGAASAGAAAGGVTGAAAAGGAAGMVDADAPTAAVPLADEPGSAMEGHGPENSDGAPDESATEEERPPNDDPTP